MSTNYYDFRSVRNQIKHSNPKTPFTYEFRSHEKGLRVSIKKDTDWATVCKEIRCTQGECVFHLLISLTKADDFIKITLIYHKNVPIAYVFFDCGSLDKLEAYGIIDRKLLRVMNHAPKELSDYILETHYPELLS